MSNTTRTARPGDWLTDTTRDGALSNKGSRNLRRYIKRQTNRAARRDWLSDRERSAYRAFEYWLNS